MTRSKYQAPLTLLIFAALTLVTACQAITDDPRLKHIFPPEPTPTVPSATPTLRATFTHLPGDLYFVYQTQTAAPTSYSAVGSETLDPLRTATPQWGYTETVVALTDYNCILAYPDFCVSRNVRYGCTELLKKYGRFNFTVLPPDPYGYDKDQDGIGCDQDQPTQRPRNK